MRSYLSSRALLIAVASVATCGALHSAVAGDSADDVARILMPNLDKFESAYRRALKSAKRQGKVMPGGRSRSWRAGGTRTRGYHSDVPRLQKRVRQNTVTTAPSAPSPSTQAKMMPTSVPQQKPATQPPVVVREVVESKAYSTASVTFEYNSDAITSPGRIVLDQTIIPALKKVRSYVAQRTRGWGDGAAETQFSVTGHTDAAGSDSYNQALSERRANAVCVYIRSHGYSGKLECVGYGETQLAVPQAPNSAANRRVEIKGVVVMKGQVASN